LSTRSSAAPVVVDNAVVVVNIITATVIIFIVHVARAPLAEFDRRDLAVASERRASFVTIARALPRRRRRPRDDE
jgi:hypothetical protein